MPVDLAGKNGCGKLKMNGRDSFNNHFLVVSPFSFFHASSTKYYTDSVHRSIPKGNMK